jgi:tRNA A37 threonylcarbamoyladenosine dehydratase
MQKGPLNSIVLPDHMRTNRQMLAVIGAVGQAKREAMPER